MHYDEDIYPQAQQFDPFRFVSRDDSNAESRGHGYTTIKPTTSADDHFFGFGTNKHPFPGRFPAVHMIKLIMAHILLNYDIEYKKEKLQFSNNSGNESAENEYHVEGAEALCLKASVFGGWNGVSGYKCVIGAPTSSLLGCW